MAFRKKQRLPEQTSKPGYSDDPFCRDTVYLAEYRAEYQANTTVVGLSDEADAKRYLALKFNPHLRVCTNCEITYELEGRCPICSDQLMPIGTPPRRRKW